MKGLTGIHLFQFGLDDWKLPKLWEYIVKYVHLKIIFMLTEQIPWETQNVAVENSGLIFLANLMG